jgi:hypothetical protein
MPEGANVPAPLRIVLGTVLTFVVMVVAILPPILHFITGPIGPGIGGFIAGRQFSLSDKEAAVMGLILALLTGVPAYVLMGRIINSDTFVILAAITASLWSGGLATIAAWFAGGDEQSEVENTP